MSVDGAIYEWNMQVRNQMFYFLKKKRLLLVCKNMYSKQLLTQVLYTTNSELVLFVLQTISP